jgi:hypothetical protein
MSWISQSIGFSHAIDQCEQQNDPVRNIEDLAKGVSANVCSFPRDRDACFRETYMCNKQNNVALPIKLLLYPESQATSAGDTEEEEDVTEPKPWLVVFGSRASETIVRRAIHCSRLPR